jgi:D-sedoheptulose 7-phosphate isomerase
MASTSIDAHSKTYTEKLLNALGMKAMTEIPKLAEALREAWQRGQSVYLCGNGGSAANAIHLANDFLYGVGVSSGVGLKVEALSAVAATPPMSSRRSKWEMPKG